jgi:voltage-gated potassium channel
LLRRVSSLLDKPMTALSFVWLILMIVEFAHGLTPAMETANYILWSAFVLHFALEFWIAPEKLDYLRSNWLTALALLLPAFRMLRVFRSFRALRLLRTARVGRGVRLVRWITSLNRGMKATQATMRKRGLGYVIVLTLLVNFVGAAAMYVFENPRALRESEALTADTSASGIRSYAESLWWTAMMLTTMGSDYFPKTPEGRAVALLLAIYGFAIFGYITATVASFILRVDREEQVTAGDVRQLRAEIADLKARLSLNDMRNRSTPG